MAVNVDDNTTINGETYTTSDAVPHREAFHSSTGTPHPIAQRAWHPSYVTGAALIGSRARVHQFSAPFRTKALR